MARHISNEFRSHLSEKLMDLGNISAGAMVIGQFVSANKFSISAFMGGLFLAFTCYTISYLVNH